ncbi:uncharacterized protein [Atheta coriaria]|uniref:uncharacterized protein n=1 Tax=Dalotia coriaria TaxID=877792 RepID=UPI0031F3AE22
MSLNKRIKHNQMQDSNQLIIAIRRLLPCYTNNITDEHLAVVSNLIEAICTDRTDKILQLLEPFDNDLKDELLSMGGMYLREHNMSITYSTAKFLHITLLSFRFYFPAVQLELVTKEENENILKYLIKHMDVILIWNGPTNQILLYHIKQVIFIANEVRFIAEVRKLLWGKLIFYMQQFIKYFTSKENIHFLQIGFISVKNLIDFIRLFKTGIECVYSKRPKSLKSVLKENESIMLHFEETYNNIRDIYVLVRIENNISRIFLRTSFLEDLRVLQILGECFKQTHATPNISPTFKQFITSYISEPCITALVTLRDSISHLTGVPVCSIEFIDEVEYLLQKIQVRCDSFIYNYVAEIKIKILNIIKSNNFENIELPCCCNLKLKPNIYNLFKDTQFRKPSRFHPELEPYEIIAINEQIQTFELIQFDKCLRKLHDALEYNHEYRIIEMLLMLILNHLNEDQKRLNTNRKWYMEKYPTLTGQQLRNHLAHGDPIVELLGLNEEIAVRDTAKLLTEELHMDVNAKRGNIQKITERIAVKRMEEIDSSKLISLEKYCKVFGCIMEGNLNKLKRHIQKIDSAWINWRDSNGRNALQCAAQNKNDDVAVFDFIYDKEKNTVNVKPSQETRDTPIFLAVLVKNYKIAKHIAEKHILALLKRDKNELGLDHLERCVASTLMLKTIALDDVWILCYYAICCNNAVQLQSILDLYYYKTLDNIWKANTSFLHIACAYGATEVVKYLINTGCNLNCGQSGPHCETNL